MEPPRIHFIRIAGEVRGPFAVEHLRDLGEINQVTAETEISASREGPWTPLRLLPLIAEVFPPRPELGFKPNDFDTINHDHSPQIEVDAIKEAALHSPASLRGREVIVKPVALRGTRDDEPLNEVQRMVQDVGQRVAAHAPPEILPPPPSRFRRWRWFVALAICGTFALLSIPLFYPDRKSDEFTFSILGGWIVLYNGFLVFVVALDHGLRDRLRRRKLKLDLSRND